MGYSPRVAESNTAEHAHMHTFEMWDTVSLKEYLKKNLLLQAPVIFNFSIPP